MIRKIQNVQKNTNIRKIQTQIHLFSLYIDTTHLFITQFTVFYCFLF